MPNTEFKVHGPDDPRLAVHATSPLPAWLWSADGTRVLWANPVGALMFGAASGARLANKIFGPADAHRRQVAQLAHRLLPNGAIRLERLRGFGSRLGTLVTCACARLEFADGSEGVLIAARRSDRPHDAADRTAAAAGRRRRCSARDFRGRRHARRRKPQRGVFDGLHHLAEAGLEEARQYALKDGRAETSLGSGHLTLLRVGNRADNLGFLALIVPAAAAAADDGVPSRNDAANLEKRRYQTQLRPSRAIAERRRPGTPPRK